MGAAKVEPAPLMVPPDLLPPLVSLLLLLLEPHAATPSASTHTAASETISRGDINRFSLFACIWTARLPGERSESVTGLWRPCEKGVKPPPRGGTRTPRGCG